MKKTKTMIASLLLMVSTALYAETAGSQEVFYIKTPRFARPLVEKWIAEYKKIDPEMQLCISTGSQPSDITLSIYNKDVNETQSTVYFGQYAVLPVTSRQSLAAKYFSKHHQSKKKLKELFFIVDEFDNSVEKDQEKRALVVYTGSNSLSVTAALASYFGQEIGSLKGKKISGDDVFLNQAISRDEEGVTFNALPNLFDLSSRQLLANISIVPLDVKKQQAEALADDTSLDRVITILENERVDGIPVEPIGLQTENQSNRLSRFLGWVLTSSKDYNHQYGLLNLSEKALTSEYSKINNTLTAQK
jgi:hypothetical protein